MLEILKDKRVWIGLAIAILFVIGIVSTVQLINKSEKANDVEQSGVGIESDQDKDTDVDEEEPYNGSGMEVVEDNKTREDSMEVPKSWEDSKTDDVQSGGGDSNENSKNESTNITDNTEQEKDENVSDEDTLKDDTSWGSIF